MILEDYMVTIIPLVGFVCFPCRISSKASTYAVTHTIHLHVIITKGIRGTTRQLYDSALWCTYIMAASVCSGTS